jgi:hypothetical protein
MKATLNGKRYDTDKCYTLAEHDYHNNGNYSGTASLIEASNGALLVHIDANGQDCWLQSSLWLFKDSDLSIDDFENIKDEDRMVELGLIEIVE